MYEATVSSTQRDYYFGADDTKYVGSSPDKINNPKLKWETSEQINVGFDSRFFNAFSLAFDVYQKTTKDWLIIAPVTALAGTDARPLTEEMSGTQASKLPSLTRK